MEKVANHKTVGSIWTTVDEHKTRAEIRAAVEAIHPALKLSFVEP
ncbi:hypothetical protein QTI24_28440 [Variovorax sp. J22P240]|nr:hypothetical protein [Variovorax sp. J22P240]MDM0002562.1 hypothetical protein [Variovorax sp. J22P240]